MLLFEFFQVKKRLFLPPNEKMRVLSILPMNHLFEMTVGFATFLNMGFSVYYTQSLKPKDILNMIKDRKINFMISVPAFLRLMKTTLEAEMRNAPKFYQFMFKFNFSYVAKFIPFEMNITIEKAMDTSIELVSLYNHNEDVRKLIDMAKRVEGMPRHASTHPAGVVISAVPVSEIVPLQKNDESIVIQYCAEDIEPLGLLKMDFLALRTLTVIRDCVELIRKNGNPEFSEDRIFIDSKPVYEMLSTGNSIGVFQFESKGMRSVLSQVKPRQLEELIAVMALYRPGPMESIPKYIHNRNYPQNVEYPVPQMKEILDITYGCMVYQEQVMEICRKLAGYSYGRADIVRRAMSKKKHEVMEKERENFVSGAIKNKIPEKVARDIFYEMIGF